MTNKQKLTNCFNNAIARKAKYIGVAVVNENYPGVEVIINPNENFRDKLEYYHNAYDDNLELKTYSAIKITAFTYGDDIEKIGTDLLV